MDTPDPEYQVVRRVMGEAFLLGRREAARCLLEGKTVEVAAMAEGKVLCQVRVRGYRTAPSGKRLPPEFFWGATLAGEYGIAEALRLTAVMRHAVNVARTALMQELRDQASQSQVTP